MIERFDCLHLADGPREDLIAVLASITNDITALIQDVAVAEAQELQSRVDGWQHATDSTIKGREMAATVASAAAKQMVIDRKADLAIRTEEKWFVLRLLDGATDRPS